MGLLIILNILNTLLLGVVVAKVYSKPSEAPTLPPTPKVAAPPVKRTRVDFSDPYREARQRLKIITDIKGN